MTLSLIMLKIGQTCFKDLMLFHRKIWKYFWLFFNIMKERLNVVFIKSGFVSSQLAVTYSKSMIKHYKLWNMFKINNSDTRTRPLASFWRLYCYLWTHFAPCSSVFIANFEHVMPDGLHGTKDLVIDTSRNEAKKISLRFKYIVKY